MKLLFTLLKDEEVEAAAKVLKSGRIGLGSSKAEFEKQFASYIGVPSLAGLNSGAAALSLS